MKTRRTRLPFPGTALLLLALLAPAGVRAAESARAADRAGRPDIVLILADDLGFSDIGCYGSEIATPNLDRLAAGGLRFTQFYNTARCCPTRASLLTGLYPHQAGIGHMVQDLGRPAYRGDLSRHAVTIAEVLRPAGYRTAMAGKWHVTPYSPEDRHGWPTHRGFERFFGLIGSVRSYYDPPTLARDDRPVRAEGDSFYLTDAITEQAVASLEAFGKGKEPIFLYLAYTAPHWPMHALAADVARWRGKYRGGWDALRRQRHQRQIDMGLVDRRWPLTPRDPDVPAWEDAPHKDWQDARMAVYAAMIERMDRGVGRVVDRLRDLGRLDNTLILFLSDNGGCAEEIPDDLKGIVFPEKTRDGRRTLVGNNPAVEPGPAHVFQSCGRPWANASNTPFRLYKHWVHEGGIATPLIAHWPAAIRKPGITHEPGHVIDLMATCLDLAGAAYPREHGGQAILPLEGKSLRPVLEGKGRAGHEALYWEHEGNRAVRAGKWKLVSRHPGGWELYDLEADRTELHDLAKDQPEKVKELQALYDAWARRCGVVPWESLKH
jgi:arylsulfatase A-like enzyme